MRLIDADAFEVVAFKDRGGTFSDGVQWILKKIDNMPTIEERKTGKWEHGRETSREYQGKMLSKIWYEDWHCGVCGIVIECSEKPMYKFCPSCGADMREQP